MVKNKSNRSMSSVVIEPFKQVKVGVYIIGLSVVFMTVMAALFIFAFYEQYQHIADIFSVVSPGGQWELMVNHVFVRNGVILVCVFIGYLACMSFLIFKLTHRVYGPLVSIRRFMEQLEEGSYAARLTIRKKDELQGLAQNLNKLAQVLEERHGADCTQAQSKDEVA